MNFSVSPTQLVEAYGLSNVTYFPRNEVADFHDRTAAFLSSVGLPHSEIFHSRMDVDAPYEPDTDAITLGSDFDLYDRTCPPESRSWWKLGWFFTSVVAVDPQSGKVFAFPEGEDDYVELHRDVESLVYALIEFRKLEVGHNDDADPHQLSERFRRVVGAFDPTPFASEDSQWNLSLTELEDGIW